MSVCCGVECQRNSGPRCSMSVQVRERPLVSTRDNCELWGEWASVLPNTSRKASTSSG